MVTRLPLALFLSFAVVSGACAHESDRIDELERELIETQKKLLDTRKRLSILESMIRDQGNEKKPVASDKADSGDTDSAEDSSSERKRPNAAWRQLSAGMSTNKVFKIIGDPQRIKGGKITTWYYPNGGSVVFWDGYLNEWTEPN